MAELAQNAETAAAPLDQPVPFRLLLDEAAKRARRHFTALFFPVALPVAAAQVLMVVAQYRFMGQLTLEGEPDPRAILVSVGGFCSAVLLFMVVYGLGYGAMGAASVDAAAGRAVRMGRSWRFVLRPRVLLTLLSMGVAVSLGMLFCLLPGLWLTLLLGFALPVMVEEGELLGGAWRRSSRLARYNPQRRLTTSPMFKVFVFLVVGMLLSQAISLALQMPLVFVQQLFIFREAASGADPNALLYDARWLWLQVPVTLLGSLAQSAVVLYLSFGMALLYFDVQRRRDGVDLEAALDELEGRPPASVYGAEMEPGGGGWPEPRE